MRQSIRQPSLSPIMPVKRISSPPANSLQSAQSCDEILSRISLYTLLHAQFYCRGVRPAIAGFHRYPALRRLGIACPGDLDTARRRIVLPSDGLYRPASTGLTFLGWLEHAAWLLGLSPLSRDATNLSPGRYSGHITFFGDYSDGSVPSTVSLKQWIGPSIWGVLLSTHNLLTEYPLEKYGDALASQMSNRSFCIHNLAEPVLSAIDIFLTQTQRHWSQYKTLAFAQ